MRIDSTQQLQDLVANATLDLIMAGVTAKVIAKGCSLSPSTISRFAFRQTTRPQLHTVVAILGYLGYHLTLERNTHGHRVMAEHKEARL